MPLNKETETETFCSFHLEFYSRVFLKSPSGVRQYISTDTATA